MKSTQKILFILLILGFLFLLDNRQSYSMMPQFVDIPDNTWIKIDTAPTERFICTGFTDCTQKKIMSNPVGRSYSGITYGNGKIFYFGGGHKSHPGNDVEIYDITNSQWIQQYQPEGVPESCLSDPNSHPACSIIGGGGSSVVTPNGRPFTEHIYQQFAYDPNFKRFIGLTAAGTWAYDPTIKEWIPLAGKYAGDTLTPNNRVGSALLLYDSNQNVFVAFVTGSDNPEWKRRVAQFDPSTNTWTLIGYIPSEARDEIYGAYDPVQRVFIISATSLSSDSPTAPRTIWAYSLEKNEWKNLTSTAPKEIYEGTYEVVVPAVAYDSLNNVILLAAFRRLPEDQMQYEFFTYNVEKDQWTKLSPIGDKPTAPKLGVTPWNYLVYDPENNVFFLVNVLSVGGSGKGGTNDGAVEVWVYRYRNAPLTLDSIPPNSPTGLIIY